MSKNAFNDTVLAEVTEGIHILEADAFQKERGNEFVLMTSSNGYAWSATHAFSRDDARKLRDALTELL